VKNGDGYEIRRSRTRTGDSRITWILTWRCEGAALTIRNEKGTSRFRDGEAGQRDEWHPANRGSRTTETSISTRKKLISKFPIPMAHQDFGPRRGHQRIGATGGLTIDGDFTARSAPTKWRGVRFNFAAHRSDTFSTLSVIWRPDRSLKS